MEYIGRMLGSAMGCYVLGSLLLAVAMILYFKEGNRKLKTMEWKTVLICLPFLNVIIVSFLILSMFSAYTGNPIIIGRRKA